jgi:hypothetical protein
MDPLMILKLSKGIHSLKEKISQGETGVNLTSIQSKEDLNRISISASTKMFSYRMNINQMTKIQQQVQSSHLSVM